MLILRQLFCLFYPLSSSRLPLSILLQRLQQQALFSTPPKGGVENRALSGSLCDKACCGSRNGEDEMSITSLYRIRADKGV